MDQDQIRSNLLSTTLATDELTNQPDEGCKKRKIKIARWIVFFPFTFSVGVALILLYLSNITFTANSNSTAYQLNVWIFTGLLVFCVVLNIACLITGAILLRKARDC